MSFAATRVPPAPLLDEFQGSWRRVNDKAAFAILLLSWLGLFQFFGVSSGAWTHNYSLPARLWMLYDSPGADLEYAKLVPFAVLALLWHKRDRFAAVVPGPRWPSLVLLGFALALHVVGFLAQQESISTIALFLGLYSLVGVVWAWGVMREAFFPFVLFAFCIPLGSLMDTLTFRLRVIATVLTEFVSHTLLDVPLTRQGTALIKPNGHAFEVVAACSGLHSFTALLVVTTIFAMVSLKTFARRAFLIAITVPLAVACNVLRLTAMVVADRAFGPKAGAFVHDTDWILTYGIAIASIMFLGHWLREKSPPPVL